MGTLVGGVGVHHGVTLCFGSAKVCSLAILEACFSYDKDIWIAATDYTRIAKIKSAYVSLIIDPRGLVREANLNEIMGLESSDVVIFDLEPLYQGQTRIAKPISAYISLILGPRGL